MEEIRAEVLIVGAGPTGLFLAGELARHGVRPRIIEKLSTPHVQTRATGVQPASLEVFTRTGIVEPFLNEGIPVQGVRILDSECHEAFTFQGPEADTPYPGPRSMPQWRTEEVLLENLHRFGIEVERGVTAKEIELFDDRARVVCEDALGREFVIGADYLVGAGGAHSVVRGALHEHLEGITYPLRYLVGDVSVPNFHRGDHLLTVAVSPVGMLMVVELPKGRSLVFTDLPEGQIPSQPVSIEDLQSAIAGHLKRPFEISDLRWASMYHSHRRMAPKFAQGRCFLAGDAAHICNPLGGEGMNAGILDGASLAWMLAAVLRHGGRRVLLEAYEAERHDAAAQVLASSHAAKGFYDSLVAMARAGEPLIAPEPDPAHPTTSPTMLDLKFPSSPILGTHGDGVGLEGIIVGSRFPKRTRLSGCSHHLLIFDGPEAPGREVRLPERWSSLITTLRGEDICVHWQGGVPAGGAVLVRPDGYIGFQAAAWNREALHAFEGYLERLFDPEQASVGGSA